MSEINEQDVLQKLSKLADRRMDLEILQQERERAVPPEVKKILEEIESEFGPKQLALGEEITALEDEVRKAVAQLGRTIRGLRLTAIYVEGQWKWDNSQLEGYGTVHPELLSLRKKGDPSVQIRRINDKKPKV